MTCTHLRELFQLCQKHDMKITGTDLVRVVCNECGVQEVCPSTLTDEYDAKAAATGDRKSDDSAGEAISST